MAGAYATLDNHGKKVTPTLVTQATHSVNGVETKVPLKDPIGDQVLSRKTADTVTSVLTGVVNDGTASQAVKNTAYKAAGKTGTSDDDKSAWFVGYTPKLVTAVGMFGESPNGGRQVTLKNAGGDGRVNGGGYPAKVWADYTEAALNGDTGADFDLDTNMGAAIPPTPTPTPSHTPSSSPSPSKSPSDSPSPTPSKPSGPPSPTHSGRPSPPVPSDSGSPDGGADGGAAGGDGGPGGGTGGETGGTRPDSLPGFG